MLLCTQFPATGNTQLREWHPQLGGKNRRGGPEWLIIYRARTTFRRDRLTLPLVCMIQEYLVNAFGNLRFCEHGSSSFSPPLRVRLSDRSICIRVVTVTLHIENQPRNCISEKIIFLKLIRLFKKRSLCIRKLLIYWPLFGNLNWFQYLYRCYIDSFS